MAPWTSRILSPNSRSHEFSPALNGSSLASPARPRAPARVTEEVLLDQVYGVPTLPIKSTSSHGRSMSHPFPSLFSGKKHTGTKKNKDAGLDSADERTIPPAVARQTAQNPGARQTKVVADLMTGKCMACDSMVRWPKELNVFRCTVCMTINDLKPVVLEARRGDGHRAPVARRAGTYPGSPNQQHSKCL